MDNSICKLSCFFIFFLFWGKIIDATWLFLWHSHCYGKCFSQPLLQTEEVKIVFETLLIRTQNTPLNESRDFISRDLAVAYLCFGIFINFKLIFEHWSLRDSISLPSVMLSVESPCWSAVRFPPRLKLRIDTDLGSDFIFLKHWDILPRANAGSVFWCNFAVEWENDGRVTHTSSLHRI